MESERERAAKAVVATSVLDFTKKVLISLNLLCFSYLVFCPALIKDQLSLGFKLDRDSYVKLDTALFDGYVSF